MPLIYLFDFSVYFDEIGTVVGVHVVLLFNSQLDPLICVWYFLDLGSYCFSRWSSCVYFTPFVMGSAFL